MNFYLFPNDIFRALWKFEYAKLIYSNSHSGNFAVKYRDAVIQNSWKEDLHKYITGIVKNNRHKMLSINTMPDHLHMFFGLRPRQSLSDLMQQVKGDSSEWINKKKFTLGNFQWQEGFGGFSYAKSQISVVCNYIQNQEKAS